VEAGGGGSQVEAVHGGRLPTIALIAGGIRSCLQQARARDVRHDHDAFVRFTIT